MTNKNLGRKALVRIYNDLIASKTSQEFLKFWKKFKDLAMEDYYSERPIPEIAFLPRNIELKYGIHHKKNGIAILNHGAGTGFPDLYWISLGYENLIAFDLFDEKKAKVYNKLNKFLKQNSIVKGNVFYIYDGKKLPVGNCKIDVVISNAVVEHIPDDNYENYFIEEGRILKKGGFCIHVIPQRLQPYDSHTRTWFVHWIPRKLHVPLIKIFGNYNPNLTLVLRTRNSHVKLLKKHIGVVEDKTLDFFINTQVKKSDFMDGKKSRGVFFYIMTLPILKYFLPALFKPLMILITVTKKQNNI